MKGVLNLETRRVLVESNSQAILLSASKPTEHSEKKPSSVDSKIKANDDDHNNNNNSNESNDSYGADRVRWEKEEKGGKLILLYNHVIIFIITNIT